MGSVSPPYEAGSAGYITYIAAELRSCVKEWIDQINTGTPESVAALYDPAAVLLATFDPKPLTTPEERLNYFVNFKFASKKNLRAMLDECYPVVLGFNGGTANGLYTFQFDDDRGVGQTVKARFSFIYHREEEGEWKIKAHHSSVRPVPPVAVKREELRPV